MERYATDTSERYEIAARTLETTMDSMREKESELSELSAVLNQNKSSFAKKKDKERLLAALNAGDGRGPHYSLYSLIIPLHFISTEIERIQIDT